MNAKQELTPKQIMMFFGPLRGLPQMHCKNNIKKKKLQPCNLTLAVYQLVATGKINKYIYGTQTLVQNEEICFKSGFAFNIKKTNKSIIHILVASLENKHLSE